MTWFWVVMKDMQHLQCSMRHTSRENAIVEAQRLARQHPGSRFFVAAVTGYALYDPEPAYWYNMSKPGDNT